MCTVENRFISRNDVNFHFFSWLNCKQFDSFIGKYSCDQHRTPCILHLQRLINYVNNIKPNRVGKDRHCGSFNIYSGNILVKSMPGMLLHGTNLLYNLRKTELNEMQASVSCVKTFWLSEIKDQVIG